MERKSCTLIVMLILVPMLLAASWKTRIYRAYTGNDMRAWKAAMDEMENQKTNDPAYLAELVNYQYGYIGYCLGIDDDDAAKNCLEQAEKNLDQLEQLGFSSATINAYRSAFFGYKIALSPIKAPFFGPKSIKAAEQSILADPKNPLAYVQLGNAEFHMPAVFGGTKTKAIEYFQKAEKLMEENPETWITQNWNYLNLLALIGQSFEALNKYEEAKSYYSKAVNAEPTFKWVKDELLPNLDKKLTNE
ncbi:tetratricopeptide repeat protein [Maribellus sp. YY47]|uniref:tetratricopeptide repeat protein n=1 Tax=Maribellus sp. YY47 TaxID=2929486 RepID=UPI002000FD1D|nr:tetratricopeptide repeat protein [Maribellus sp. YY47]MCK3684133.1 hypothetical protein [Maribellus sp. YY47]